MKVKIRPGKAVGSVAVPPSKSFAHRTLLAAALAEGTSMIYGFTPCEDMLATLDCLEALGAECKYKGGCLTIKGKKEKIKYGATFNCRESGSTLRFFLPISLIDGGMTRFAGSERLMERGVSLYSELFAGRGIEFEKGDSQLIAKGKLSSGDYTLRGDVSSQFVSGMLFALPLLDGDSNLTVLPPVESRPYIDITIQVLKDFGIVIEEPTPNSFHVKGRQKYKPTDTQVEGDWSNAAALYAYNLIGGEVTLTGLKQHSLQGDRVCIDMFKMIEDHKGPIDISATPDLGPILFAAAAIKGGGSFTGTKRLRIKESDRVQSMVDELKKFGIKVEAGENTVTVLPGELHKPTSVICGHNDHRIIMAMALLSSVVSGVIDGVEAVKKSYPDFFDVLKRLNLEVEYES